LNDNHLTQDEPTGDISGIDADALMEQIDSGGPSAPQDPGTAQPTGQEPSKTAAQIQAELEFEAGGKPIKVPYTDPRLKQWAQQGYDYSQKMAAYNQERQKWDASRQEYEKSYQPYKVIDDYAKQNPDWWKHVQATWDARDQSTQAAGAAAALPPEVKEKLEHLESFVNDIKSEREQQKIKADDERLSAEIQGIRKEFANLPWDSKDEQGLTLEGKVLKHAMDMGLDGSKPGHFRAAFRDYAYSDLIRLSSERAKEEQTKNLQSRTKLGLLGSSSTPKKGVQPAEGIRNKSYDDLLREAKEELNVS
jgi:hypothetical protein